MTRRITLAAGVAGLVVAVALVVVAVLGGDSDPPTLRSNELSAEGLVDSIGVNVHFNYLDTSYARQVEVLARVRELGIRHLRDAMPLDGQPLATVLPAAARLGMRMTLLTDQARDPMADVEHSVSVLGSSVAAVEGPNELDNFGDPSWLATLTDYMPRLRTAMRAEAPAVPLIGPSLVNPSSRAELPADLPGAFNAHPYPKGGHPEPELGEAVRAARAGRPRRPAYFTEIGYHNAHAATSGQPPVSEEAAAVYLPRALVAAYGAGVRRTFVYELLDEKHEPAFADPEQHFGLLRNDLSPKPAFEAIRTLVSVMRSSPGAGSGSLRWRLRSPDGGDLQRLTLVRRDGSRVLAFWRPASVWDQAAGHAVDPGSVPVELLLDREASEVEVWRPSVSGDPVLRRDRARRLRLGLAGDLVLVSLR